MFGSNIYNSAKEQATEESGYNSLFNLLFKTFCGKSLLFPWKCQQQRIEKHQSFCPIGFFFCCQEDDAVMVKNMNPSQSMSVERATVFLSMLFYLICDSVSVSLFFAFFLYTSLPLFALCNKTLKR